MSYSGADGHLRAMATAKSAAMIAPGVSLLAVFGFIAGVDLLIFLFRFLFWCEHHDLVRASFGLSSDYLALLVYIHRMK